MMNSYGKQQTSEFRRPQLGLTNQEPLQSLMPTTVVRAAELTANDRDSNKAMREAFVNWIEALYPRTARVSAHA